MSSAAAATFTVKVSNHKLYGASSTVAISETPAHLIRLSLVR